jgi:hypothetical protein
MENQFKIDSTKATLSLILTVVLFFSSIGLGFIYSSKGQWILIAFLLLALVFLGLSFITYRIFSGAYYIAIKPGKLVLSSTVGKTEIALTEIEKIDYVKGKSLFKGDDTLVVEYKKGQKMEKAKFLLFYLKDKGDKIYASIISELEKMS